MATIHRSQAEQELTARYDQEERVIWLGTTTPWIARRWQRARYAVQVIGTVGGAPASWEAKLPWTGRKAPWLRALSLSLPTVRASAASRAANTATAVLSPANETLPKVTRVGIPLAPAQNGTAEAPSP